MFSRKNKEGTERLSRSIAAYNAGIGMRGAAVHSLPAKQPYFVQAAPSAVVKPVQLLRITTHGQGNAERAGGGVGSGIKTGNEVRAIIQSNDTSDITQAISLLRRSIHNREQYSHLFTNIEPNHAERIAHERRWLADLEAAFSSIQSNHAANLHRTMNGGPATVNVTHHGNAAAIQGNAADSRFVSLPSLGTQDNDKKQQA
ncbi:hypothetical protein [Sediminibacterium goheungense]|uniref:Uncharacterized protein n=1 Tax=Sediminibacterium goheungense TaxID=1086393 RepID=A0A4R6IUW1_9BACT|nr:hypothetical protein [Sediminibacterium goheungense]TDO25736.1 hypothetical protein BC659_2659 [Sediminibacterium goheungense]